MVNEKQTDSPSWPEVIRSAVNSMLGDVHTGLPGRVEKWDPVTQKADIKPLIKRVFYTFERDRIVEELPVIPNVPVLFHRTGKFMITFPIKKGDHVQLTFMERSIDQFMAKQGDDTDPLDVRRFDLSDAVARLGFYPDSKALKNVDPDDMVLGVDGGVVIHIKEDGTIHLGSKMAADALALASKVDANQTTLQVAHDAHVHLTTATVSGGPPGVLSPTSAPVGALPATGSAVVKAD